MTTSITRRTFAAATAATTLAFSTASARVLGANDRIRLGFIGVGNRGSQLLDAFLQHSDKEVVAFCDVYEPYLARANAKLDRKAETYKDFRKLLDRNDLDAVVIATPDHWHAIQTIAACEAGKDVYIEKPLSITIHEGRRMVEAARRNSRITQVGTHRRSSSMYTDLAELVQQGKIGKVTISRAYRLSNMATCTRRASAKPSRAIRLPIWTGTFGSVRGRRGRFRRRSHPTNSAGGTSTARRLPTGACTISTPSAG
jgi:hypothetical protein